MYIYYNNEGKPTTKIPHGYPVKQGNALKVTMCFETDFFDEYLTTHAIPQKDIMLSISLIYSNGEQSSNFIVEGGTNGPTEIGGTNIRKQFIKLSDNEETYDLINYKEYLMFNCEIDAEVSTVHQGSLKFVVKIIYKKDDSEKTEDIGYLDTAQLFVDPTWGNAEFIPDLTGNQYEQLLGAITKFEQELLNKANVGAFPFKSIELKGLTFTFTSSDDKELTADINVKNTSVATITVDETPRKDSPNLVTSGAVYNAGYQLIKRSSESDTSWIRNCYNNGLKSVMVIVDNGTIFTGKIINEEGLEYDAYYKIVVSSNIYPLTANTMYSEDFTINAGGNIIDYYYNTYYANSQPADQARIKRELFSTKPFKISAIYVKGV